MKYLISAHSVNPYKGSEDYTGWNWILQLSKNAKPDDEIYVITKKYNEKDTRNGLEENKIKNVKLLIVDVPKVLDWFREKNSMFHHIYYILWQYFAYRYIKKSKINFDVIHHVTMGDYRIIGKMYKFKNAYTILGPIGGAQTTPKSLKKNYEKNKILGGFREFINKSCSYNPFYKNAIKKFNKVYAINYETQSQLEKILKHRVDLLPELALREEYKYLKINKKKNDIKKILFVGRLINKKGLDLLIDVLKLIPKNIKWKLDIYGDGKEKNRIEKKIKDNKLQDNIILKGKRNFTDISDAYKSADIFVLPSLRETGGNVLIEAMAHKLPIISLDTSFSSYLKQYNCGIFINTKQDEKKIKIDFCEAIIKLIQSQELCERFGQNGYEFVNQNLTWEQKYNIVYKEIENRS